MSITYDIAKYIDSLNLKCKCLQKDRKLLAKYSTTKVRIVCPVCIKAVAVYKIYTTGGVK